MTHPEASIPERMPTILVGFRAPQYVGGGAGRLVIDLGCTGIQSEPAAGVGAIGGRLGISMIFHQHLRVT